MELIQIELQRIIQPIPSRPRETHVITFDRPSATMGAEPGTPEANTLDSRPEAGG